MEEYSYYESETESPIYISEILKQNGVTPSCILSPVGGYPWPVFFSEEFEKASIISFDNNQRQVQEYSQQVLDSTNRAPFYLDLKNTDKLSRMLDKYKVDLFFLSNIPDYLEPEKNEEIAELISEYEIPTLIFSHMPTGLYSKGFQSEGFSSFAQTLKEQGYEIKKYKDSSTRYEITDYFIASLI